MPGDARSFRSSLEATTNLLETRVGKGRKGALDHHEDLDGFHLPTRPKTSAGSDPSVDPHLITSLADDMEVTWRSGNHLH